MKNEGEAKAGIVGKLTAIAVKAAPGIYQDADVMVIQTVERPGASFRTTDGSSGFIIAKYYRVISPL